MIQRNLTIKKTGKLKVELVERLIINIKIYASALELGLMSLRIVTVYAVF